MAGLISMDIDLSKIDKSKIKDGKWLNTVIALNDETNEYGQNASMYHSQTKEQRDAKVKKVFVGNGKVIWVDPKQTELKLAERVENVSNSEQNPARKTQDSTELDDLVF